MSFGELGDFRLFLSKIPLKISQLIVIACCRCVFLAAKEVEPREEILEVFF